MLQRLPLRAPQEPVLVSSASAEITRYFVYEIGLPPHCNLAGYLRAANALKSRFFW